jgi:3-mercaptopyruvate sulfurtransferase SseA
MIGFTGQGARRCTAGKGAQRIRDPWWATRVWWLLRTIGFDRAAALDGDLKKWRA